MLPPQRGILLRLRGPTRVRVPSRQFDAEVNSTDPMVSDPSCCSEGWAKNVLLAQGDAKEAGAQAQATRAEKKPNIIMIMADDVGWFNLGAYHQGIMASRTPNLDRLAAEGMRFTDYYAEASCTAGRANFITGQLPIRTGMTTVGQAGSTIGMPAQCADHRHRPQVGGVCHRAVWQEPPRRPQRIPADCARLR